jgi:hypothetical protein
MTALYTRLPRPIHVYALDANTSDCIFSIPGLHTHCIHIVALAFTGRYHQLKSLSYPTGYWRHYCVSCTIPKPVESCTHLLPADNIMLKLGCVRRSCEYISRDLRFYRLLCAWFLCCAWVYPPLHHWLFVFYKKCTLLFQCARIAVAVISESQTCHTLKAYMAL